MKWIVAGPLLLLAIASGCSDDSTGPSVLSYYDRWRSMQFHHYTMVQTRVCFCADGGVAKIVTVRADTIFSVMRIADSTMLPGEEARLSLTIDSLFAIILHPGADSLVVTYEPRYGYPASLDINPQLHPVDGGIQFVTSNVQPLAP